MSGHVSSSQLESSKFLAEPDSLEDVFGFADDNQELLENLPDIYPAGGTKSDALWPIFIANWTGPPRYIYPARQAFSIHVQALKYYESSEDEVSQFSETN